MNNEFFPPTEDELQKIIKILKFRLEDSAYKDEWVLISEELQQKENQLQQLTILNNAL